MLKSDQDGIEMWQAEAEQQTQVKGWNQTKMGLKSVYFQRAIYAELLSWNQTKMGLK